MRSVWPSRSTAPLLWLTLLLCLPAGTRQAALQGEDWGEGLPSRLPGSPPSFRETWTRQTVPRLPSHQEALRPGAHQLCAAGGRGWSAPVPEHALLLLPGSWVRGCHLNPP